MPAPDRKGRATRTPEYIHPPLSVVIRLQPKGGLSACIRFDQKCGTKNPNLLSQIRILVVEVTGFEPATFWSRMGIWGQHMTFDVSQFKHLLNRCCILSERNIVGPLVALSKCYEHRMLALSTSEVPTGN